MKRFRLSWLLGLWLLPVLSAVLTAADVPDDGTHVEKFPDGKTRIQAIYKDGKLNGPYQENYENGKNHIRTTYRDGLLDGNYVESYDTGKPKTKASYRKGKLNGPFQTFNKNGVALVRVTYDDGICSGPYMEFAADGITVVSTVEFENGVPEKINGDPAFPRTKDEVLAGLQAILKGKEFTGGHDDRYTEQPQNKLPLKVGGLKPAYGADALAYLEAYRFLAGVPSEKIVLNSETSMQAQFLAVLCQYQYDSKAWPPPDPHHPPPLTEVDRNFWTAADKCAAGSLIYDHDQAQTSLRQAVLSWMREGADADFEDAQPPPLAALSRARLGRLRRRRPDGDAVLPAGQAFDLRRRFHRLAAAGLCAGGIFRRQVDLERQHRQHHQVQAAKVGDQFRCAGDSAGRRLRAERPGVENQCSEVRHRRHRHPQLLAWRVDGLKIAEGMKLRVDINLDKSSKGGDPHIQYIVEFIKDGSQVP